MTQTLKCWVIIIRPLRGLIFSGVFGHHIFVRHGSNLTRLISCQDLSTRLVADRRFPHGVRPYTVREYARLQGVPDAFTFAGSSNDAYRMIGNGVSVPVGKWIGSEIVRYFQ